MGMNANPKFSISFFAFTIRTLLANKLPITRKLCEDFGRRGGEPTCEPKKKLGRPIDDCIRILFDFYLEIRFGFFAN